MHHNLEIIVEAYYELVREMDVVAVVMEGKSCTPHCKENSE